MSNTRQILREELEKNSLGVHVSNPSHILYVMSGVPGAGKSTKAKELANGSEIYSTDDRVEEVGDYNEFFATMKKSGNFGALGRMHELNYKKACGAMDRGVNPIVIDNTNLSPSEPKQDVISGIYSTILVDHFREFTFKGWEKKKEEAAAPAGPPADIQLLTEIRDLLKK